MVLFSLWKQRVCVTIKHTHRRNIAEQKADKQTKLCNCNKCNRMCNIKQNKRKNQCHSRENYDSYKQQTPILSPSVEMPLKAKFLSS